MTKECSLIFLVVSILCCVIETTYMKDNRPHGRPLAFPLELISFGIGEHLNEHLTIDTVDFHRLIKTLLVDNRLKIKLTLQKLFTFIFDNLEDQIIPQGRTTPID